MLSLLLDEHISPEVARGLRRKHRSIVVRALIEWEEGSYLGQDDASCLRAAARQKLTLVTYDRRTIPPLLKACAEQGISHGGVIFVDEKSIAPSDVGGLVSALSHLTRDARDWDWTDRICFLRR
jgi:hypothetical protein